MRPRQSLIEIFSTFAQFDAEKFSSWATDFHLRRSMQNSLAQAEAVEHSESFWGLYWYKIWQSSQPKNQQRSRSHLSAYLQEVCYWSAQKTSVSFPNAQYSVSDYFQVAIATIDKVLKGFNPARGYKLKNYASIIFTNVIRENLRQRQEIDICTPWALLRKLSQKRLTEALQAAGIAQDEIASYLLAWRCFKSLYVPSLETERLTTRQLSKPDRATLEAIAVLYNQERPPAELQCQPETLEQWLLDCAKAARAYLYPAMTSLDAAPSGQEGGEWQDYLPASESESLLADAIAQQEALERGDRQALINQLLSAAIADMDAEIQKLLQLYYSQTMTQQQIAKHLDMKQYTISRRLTKARQSLLLVLAKWSQEQLHISLTSDVLNGVSTILEEWLSDRYSHSSPALK
jgi:RNA polymerase sigma factor (sigma-70 family)